MIVARLLLERGSDINAKHKNTALHRAIEKGDYKAAQLLVYEGADTAIPNLRGLPPLHLALRECTKNEVDAALYITLLASNSNVKDRHGKIVTFKDTTPFGFYAWLSVIHPHAGAA